MHQGIRGPRVVAAVLLAVLASLALAACGSSSSSSSGDAATLLKQTFTGSHKISSGNLTIAVTVDPSGSTTLSGPIKLSFGGPFENSSAGKLPQSDFTVSVSALGKSGSLGLLSTGKSGYVTLQGASYQLPQATFQKLESSLSQVGTPGNSNGSGTLAKLGIKPLDWLQDPKVVGTESVGGTDTTHITASINVAAFLNDFSTFLQKASSLGVSGVGSASKGLSPAVRSEIASAVENPRFDLWTGNSDKTLRRLTVALTLPVTGATSTQLGGLRSADIGLSMQYGDVNQPQTITAPKTLRPYSEFTSKVQSFVQSLQGSLGSSLLPGTASSSGSGSSSGSSSSGASSKIQRYSNCVTAAGSDVAKMQGCASILNGS
ncbi:MAG: hypothetical protein ACXVR0_15870 [Solirubrobacteraceae bacterium]